MRRYKLAYFLYKKDKIMFLYKNIRKYKDINQFEVKYLAFYGIIDNRDGNVILYAMV